MIKVKSIIPKEHGAWSMLFVPFFISAGVSLCFDFKMLLLFFGILFLYLTRRPIEELLRIKRSSENILEDKKTIFYWLIAFVFIGLLFIAPLFLKYNLIGLIPFGILFIFLQIINIAQIKRKTQRTVSGELIGIAGLCLTGPIGYYVATERIGNINFLLWCISFIYYARSVLYVKLRVSVVTKRAQFQNWREKYIYGRNYIYYHSVLLIIVYLILVSFNEQLVIVAYIPVTIQSLVGILNLSTKLNIRRLGYIEVFHSIAFGLLIVFVL